MKFRILPLLVLAIVTSAQAQSIPSPSEFLSIKVGTDRVLADYRQIASYMRALDAASPRVQVESLGKSTLGEEMLMVVISSEDNIAHLDRIREISRKLADPRGLSASQINELVTAGKTVVLVTCNIHSTEIASSQMAMEWAHALATATDPETRKRLDNVVLLLVPSLNPDGQILETEWYRKYVGTKYEGSRMPRLYHQYVGHDNNRDWFMLTQKETQELSRAIYHKWFPQLFVDEHQMGSDGPRMFIPPFADPIDPDVHPLIWREANLIGATMAFRLEQQQKAGLIYGYSFDAYWIGGTRNTGWWKNITGLLLETASAKMASPIYVDRSELEGGRKGLIEYKATINHPNPWKGGWWRMRDIMDYERIASDALLEIASDKREDFLRNIVARATSAVRAGEGSAYRIPSNQRDYPTARRLAELMADHGVEVMVAENGDFWIPLAQPYSLFVREMFQPTSYPETKVVEGKEILQPYDVAAWSLPLMMGVEVEQAVAPKSSMTRLMAPLLQEKRANIPYGSAVTDALPAAKYFTIESSSTQRFALVNRILKSGGEVYINAPADSSQNAGDGTVTVEARSVDAAGIVTVPRRVEGKGSGLVTTEGVLLLPSDSLTGGARRLRTPRVGLYKPFTASIDEGWTRWLTEQHGFDPKSLDNQTIQAGKLFPALDAIILPDLDPSSISKAKPKTEEGSMKYFEELPPEYRGGLEEKGSQALKDFVESGGTLIAMGSSCNYVIDQFNVPVRNVLLKTKEADFLVPGSLLRATVNQNHPVTFGLPKEVSLFLDASMAFETTLPGSEMQRWVLASYPSESRTMLTSGWIRGEDRLASRAAAVAMTYGKGKIVLLGFRPQHRAQMHGTFPFLFNAIYWSVL